MARILVVDDDKDIRNVFQRAFENAGHEVFIAEDGKVCELLYEKHLPDIVILDIIMPAQEGIETILNLKAKHDNVKIIAISGGGLGVAENYLDNALKFGAKAVFEKPVNHNELLKEIDLLLL
ncbi:MAG: response regulator [Bacteroidota bacterium]